MLLNLQSADGAVGIGDIDGALGALQEYLNNCYAPSQIDDGVRFILANKNQFFNKDLAQIFKTLQKLISQKMLLNGETPDAFYNFLYDIAPSMESDELITQTIIALKDFYKEADKDSAEALIIRNLLFTLAIFNGSKEDGFDEYFKSTIAMRLDKMEIMPDGFSLFMDLLKSFNLPFERLESIYKTIFELEYFFSLDKVERRSVLVWSFHCVWNVPHYFNNLKWTNLYEYWKAILFRYLENELIDEAMYLHFYMHHKMGNSAQEAMQWQKFNDEIEMPCSISYSNYAAKLNLPPCKTNANGKIKLAFLKDRVVSNSPFKVEYSLLKALKENEEFNSKFDACVYSMNYFEKSHDGADAVKMLQDIGVPLFSPAYLMSSEHYYVNHLQKALTIREAIIKDGIDILVACTNNYAIESFLLGSRSASKQIFWSHGSAAYDVLGIDERISHCSLVDNKFDFKAFSVPMDIETFYNPYRDPRDIARERAKYPQDTFILGTIGRLVKVDSDEYLEAIAEIMNQNPNTIYIAAGAGDMQTIRNKVEALGISERFYMPGHVDAHIYGHVIDMWLDTFPLQGGEAVSEFTSKNKCAAQYFPPNKNLELLTDESAMQAHKEITDKFNKNVMFISLKEYNVSTEHAMRKITELLNKVSEMVFVTVDAKFYKALTNEYGIKEDRLLFIDSSIFSETHRFLIDVDISLFGSATSVYSVEMKQYFSTQYRSINSKWITLYDNTSKAPSVFFEYEKFSIDNLWYHNYTTSCSKAEYIQKASRLIQDVDFRDKIITAISNSFKLEKAKVYERLTDVVGT